MGWSLGYLPPREPKRLDEFFLAVGKTLYLANGYEAKCRWLLEVVRMVDALQDGNDLDAAMMICRALKEKTLASTLAEVYGSPVVHAEDIESLEAARHARNFIAHEAALLGHISAVKTQQLDERMLLLRQSVSSLAIGDNLVSRWIYEIGEKEPAPSTICTEYPKWIDAWVFDAEWPLTNPSS